MNLPGPWSYSALKAFKTCARQYYELKVVKNYPQPDTEATLYGKEFHAAAENYVRDKAPVPEQFGYAKPQLDTLQAIPGTKYCEHKMALREDLTPCDFFAKDAWCRGVADLLIINEETGIARCLDYKSSKSAKYADTAQLELMALMIFKHFPNMHVVKGGLLFVVANEFKPATYEAGQAHIYWRTWMQDVNRLETAHRTGVWNPTKSGLCKRHCVVTTCPHNGQFKG